MSAYNVCMPPADTVDPTLPGASKKELGITLRTLRQIRDWSQQELAAATGLKSGSVVSEIEKGKGSDKRRNATLGRFLTALNLPAEAGVRALTFIREIESMSLTPPDSEIGEAPPEDPTAARIDDTAEEVGELAQQLVRSLLRGVADLTDPYATGAASSAGGQPAEASRSQR